MRARTLKPTVVLIWACWLGMSTTLTVAQTTYYVNGSCGDDTWTGISPGYQALDSLADDPEASYTDRKPKFRMLCGSI